MTKELVKSGNNAVATQPSNSNYIAMILEEMQRGFIEANEGLELDFVHIMDWLKISKKGNFVERDDESVNYGDSLDVVVGKGEQRWSLFGAEDSPEDGQLIVAEKTEEEAHNALLSWLEANQQAQERYSPSDIKLRYMAAIVPVKFLTPDDTPKVYVMVFSPSDTIEWGKFAYSIYKGSTASSAAGIPKKTPVSRVVVRLETTEKSNSSSQSWIGLKFTPVGLFSPADYGIDYNGTAPEAAEKAE